MRLGECANWDRGLVARAVLFCRVGFWGVVESFDAGRGVWIDE